MPKKFIKRFMPSDKTVREHPSLRFLGNLHINPNLWHLNQHSVAMAVSIGLFYVFVPLPLHTLLAAFTAVLLHGNLPLTIAVLWINNPLTLIPLYYFAYDVGLKILKLPHQSFDFEFSLEWLINDLEKIWEPFLLGCLILAVSSALIGQALTRVLWHCSVRYRWAKRQQRRLALKHKIL